MLNLNNPTRPAFYGMPIKFLPSPLLVKPYSTKELSMIYGVSTKTFLKWLLPFTHLIGEKKGRFYTVRQVETIFDRLGMPYSI
jgi:transposase